MDGLPEIMAYRWRRVSPRGAVGQKDNSCCPRCGAAAYRFAGRYKVCDSCGLSTRFERTIRAYCWYARQGRLAEVSPSVDTNLLCRYIRAWAAYQQANEVR